MSSSLVLTPVKMVVPSESGSLEHRVKTEKDDCSVRFNAAQDFRLSGSHPTKCAICIRICDALIIQSFILPPAPAQQGKPDVKHQDA